jgi:ubiquinone/menaquinone biosynthesis C-methylase UbiE
MPVDLEALAAGYSHRPTSMAGLARARRAGDSAGLEEGDVALDIGGGRGRHAQVWLERNALPLVIDPAQGMAEAAATVPGVNPIRARAQAIPISDGRARLAYFHLSIHYGDWRRSLDEVRRVVAPGGQCWIWTMGEQHHRESFLARWFPSVGDIDAARFPDPEGVANYLSSMNVQIEMGKEVETKTRAAGEWRAAVMAGFVSTLQLIPDEELTSGLAAFDATYPDPTQSVEYALVFDWICARM